MNIKVETSKADYDAFYAHVASKKLKPYTWISMLKRVCFCLALTFSVMSFLQFQSGKIESKLFFSILTLSISFIIYVVLSKYMIIKINQCFTPNKNGIIIGPKEFEISSDGIKEIHPYGYNFYNWDVVEHIEEVNGSIYVFVDKILALIFNPESLNSDKCKEELLGTLKKYV